MHPNTLDVQPFCNSNLQSHSGTVSHCILPYSKPFQNFKELASTGIKRIKILAAAGNPCAFNAFKTMIALVFHPRFSARHGGWLFGHGTPRSTTVVGPH